ncbi:MAG TPA: hypothetical protein VMW28_06615, partial [Pelolinea sp.]|nr:hypothetical protein [Pelolinea sp.]
GINIVGRNTANNLIVGNHIGTNAEGLTAFQNYAAGIWIGDDARDNIIGGRFGIEGNVISGNDNGIIIQYSDGNIITGNLIGLDKTGEKALPNHGAGIGLNFRAQNNIIGGEGFELRNVISGNGCGICLNDSQVTGNQIVGNFIGPDIQGKEAIGNGSNGVGISNDANGNQIGPGNKIAYNKESGIFVTGKESNRNTLTQNSIFSNGDTAIRNQEGGNFELSPPVIQQVDNRSIKGLAIPTQLIEIYSDSSDECEIYEGEVSSDEAGNFSFILPAGSFHKQFITATVRDGDNNTSELSKSKVNPAYGILGELPDIVAPAQVSTDPAVAGTNLGLALFAAVFFGFTSTIFNNILKNNGQDISRFFTRIFPYRMKGAFIPVKKKESDQASYSGWGVIVLWFVIILITAIVESFLDPRVGFLGIERIRIILTLLLAGLIISGLEWASDRYAHQKLARSILISWKVQWTGLFFAVGCVLISRWMNFTPGYLYGILGVIYLLPKISGREKSGKRAAIVQAAIFLGGLFFWGTSHVLPDALRWLEPVFLTIFLIGLQGVLFELIPMDFFDGGDLWKWNKSLWLLFFSVVFFCFFHVMLNPNASDIQALQQNGVKTLLLVMGIFGFLTFLLWFAFKFQVKKT